MKIQEQWLNEKNEILDVKNNILVGNRKNREEEPLNLVAVYVKYIDRILEEGGVMRREENDLVVVERKGKKLILEAPNEQISKMEEIYEEVNAFMEKEPLSSEELLLELDQLIKGIA